jgi:hypothetical protein
VHAEFLKDKGPLHELRLKPTLGCCLLWHARQRAAH